MVRQPLPIPVGVTILTEPHRQARHGSARGPSPAEQEGRRTLAVVTPLAPALDARVGRLPTWRGGRCREGEHVMRARALLDCPSAPGASRSQRWAGGGIALSAFLALFGAWC